MTLNYEENAVSLFCVFILFYFITEQKKMNISDKANLEILFLVLRNRDHNLLILNNPACLCLFHI